MTIIRAIKKTVLRAEIILGLAFARSLIKFVPFRWWEGSIGVINDADQSGVAALTTAQSKQAFDIGRIIKRVADKQKFDAVCFPQAITGHWILRRRGIPSSIVIGSRRDPATGIALHAWLKAGENVVTGQDQYEKFSSFARS
ncbi:lasso peptide biosynthesis B2 protein [Erythrobacter sp. F6033]|uniref:lasso peptide biosynthesis B2 protein n=1 Tax=Erythrobacter sp. F6033 TaxID=2926401 RepID=UPI001FF372E5|nr:lasso peptide biosynthesis B2 protein [Erythrobacter sp. F6033]MCK0127656.1 lasso peptide biosynthesis B2 protein [Erythrobacter sp. F6033]